MLWFTLFADEFVSSEYWGWKYWNLAKFVPQFNNDYTFSNDKNSNSDFENVQWFEAYNINYLKFWTILSIWFGVIKMLNWNWNLVQLSITNLAISIDFWKAFNWKISVFYQNSMKLFHSVSSLVVSWNLCLIYSVMFDCF